MFRRISVSSLSQTQCGHALLATMKAKRRWRHLQPRRRHRQAKRVGSKIVRRRRVTPPFERRSTSLSLPPVCEGVPGVFEPFDVARPVRPRLRVKARERGLVAGGFRRSPARRSSRTRCLPVAVAGSIVGHPRRLILGVRFLFSSALVIDRSQRALGPGRLCVWFRTTIRVLSPLARAASPDRAGPLETRPR
jgi:hypothetical protein